MGFNPFVCKLFNGFYSVQIRIACFPLLHEATAGTVKVTDQKLQTMVNVINILSKYKSQSSMKEEGET